MKSGIKFGVGLRGFRLSWGLPASGLGGDQFLELIYILADDVQACAPEIGRANVYAKAGCKSRCIAQACGGEEIIVVALEGFGVSLVLSIQAKAEQEAEHIREIVEREADAIVVRLDCPHIGV